jgi:site-specific DNA-methyltransferase (adenine-specific)
VLDPFSGSATTLATAKKLGRQFVGFDLSKDYVKQGRERLESIRRGDRLNGDPEPRVSAALTSVKGKSTRQDRKSAAAAAKASGQEQGSPLLTATRAGIVEAFRRTSDGFSPDRMVADPALNATFTAACESLELAGDARSWNHLLFRMRKAGDLAEIPTTRRTTLSLEECSKYLFAAEIAWQKMLAAGCPSLDEILCDPQLAARFEEIAKSYAPHIPPAAECSESLCIRWAALKLRKEAKNAAARAEVLADPLLSAEQALSEKTLASMCDEPGVYLIQEAETTALYVGAALNLREQFAFQFTPKTLALWRAEGRDLLVRVAPLQTRFAELHGYKSRLIKDRNPKLNYNYHSSAARERTIGA